MNRLHQYSQHHSCTQLNLYNPRLHFHHTFHLHRHRSSKHPHNRTIPQRRNKNRPLLSHSHYSYKLLGLHSPTIHPGCKFRLHQSQRSSYHRNHTHLKSGRNKNRHRLWMSRRSCKPLHRYIQLPHQHHKRHQHLRQQGIYRRNPHSLIQCKYRNYHHLLLQRHSYTL